jgi:hypothetical protein
VLTSVVVDAINPALDVVLADAALIVRAQQDAPAAIVDLLRLPGMHESPPTS